MWVYLYNGILFSHKNEILIHATERINFENIMLWKKAVTEDYILYYSIYIQCPEKAIYQELSKLVVGLGCVWELTINKYEKSYWGGLKNVLKSDNSNDCIIW